jgi:ketosteroid isomerase-like protein
MRALAGILLAAAAVWALPATADVAAGARVPTVTRLVKQFLELESALAADLLRGDRAAVERMLVDDFELRAGSAPGNPTPRADWIRLALAAPPSGYEIEQMAVHDYGDVAVVSFLQAATANGRRDPARDLFTVDVWKRADGAWRLGVRYAAPAGSRDVAIPGAATEAPFPKRY